MSSSSGGMAGAPSRRLFAPCFYVTVNFVPLLCDVLLGAAPEKLCHRITFRKQNVAQLQMLLVSKINLDWSSSYHHYIPLHSTVSS
jgi:hypothetical protein